MLYLYPNQGEILTMYKVGYCDIYTTKSMYSTHRYCLADLPVNICWEIFFCKHLLTLILNRCIPFSWTCIRMNFFLLFISHPHRSVHHTSITKLITLKTRKAIRYTWNHKLHHWRFDMKGTMNHSIFDVHIHCSSFKKLIIIQTLSLKCPIYYDTFPRFGCQAPDTVG